MRAYPRWGYVAALLLAVAACTSAAKKGQTYQSGDNPIGDGNGDQEDGSVLMPDPSGSQQDIGDHPAPEGGSQKEGGRTTPPDGDDSGSPIDTDGGTTTTDGGTTTGPTYCTGPLAAGDIRVVELMIKSKATTPDDGEWIEIQSARDCILKLGGVVIESPWATDAGSGYDSVTLPDGFELQPNAIFVVADTDDTTANHGITPVFSMDSIDALDDNGDTITIRLGVATTIDAFTYPKFSNLPTARSVSFPADCAWSQRSSFTNWSYSFDTYSTGFLGTPNTDNIDVTCP